MSLREPLPRVVADGPLDSTIERLLDLKVTLLPWSLTETGTTEKVDGIYTYGHSPLDGEMLDRLPGVKVISNYGVGVDHINVIDAAKRGIPIGKHAGRAKWRDG